MGKISYAKYMELKTQMRALNPYAEDLKVENTGFALFGVHKRLLAMSARNHKEVLSVKFPLGMKIRKPGSEMDPFARGIKDTAVLGQGLTDKVNPAGSAGHNPDGNDRFSQIYSILGNQRISKTFSLRPWELVSKETLKQENPSFHLAA